MIDIAQFLAKELSLKPFQVKSALELFAESASIPFIARYRKERTGEMNEIQLRELSDRFTYLSELEILLPIICWLFCVVKRRKFSI